MQLVDTHCHLDLEDFDLDLEQVIENARAEGIVRIIVPGINIESSRKAVEIASRYENVYAAVGIHPHYADKVSEGDVGILKDIIVSSEKVVAVGEVGLDYYKGFSEVSKQRDLFRRLTALSSEVDLPLIIHNRHADHDIVNILSERDRYSLKGVMHCFSGDRDLAKKIISMDLYISFAGNITFQKASGLRDVLKEVPPERLLLETDAPYLTPEPLRGRRNEPQNVKYLVDLYKNIFRLSKSDIARITTVNANNLFNLGMEDRGMLAYPIRNSLYLNITNRCTNRCTFCTRDRSSYVKGHNLRLDHEPDTDEMIGAMGDIGGYDEIVFCGFGEPTMRLDIIKKICRYVKGKNKRVRLVTNGEGDLINGRDISGELKGLVDIVSVSLNAPDAGSYDHYCRSVFGEEAYDSMLRFIRRCKDAGIEIEATCLDHIGEESVLKCRRIAEDLGAVFRQRHLNEVG